MLLMANFCYASLLEISKVDNFIKTVLSDLTIHLENYNDNGKLNLQQWQLTPRLHALYMSHSSLEEEEPTLASFMKQDFMLLMEAMTAPTANKPIDYERLEFYGDSVISFLVILELFLTTEQLHKEGVLDFYRIKAVSNMNLALINERHRLYEFIITDSTKVIGDELQPPGFESMEYHSKIKAKSVNEIKTKLAYLKKCDLVLRKRIFSGSKAQTDAAVNDDYVEMVRMFLLQSELTQPLEAAHPKAIDIYYEEREKDFARGKLACQPMKQLPFVPNEKVLSQQPGSLLYKVGCRWLFELGLTLDHLRLCVVQSNITKVESKYKKEKAKKQQAVVNQLA